MQGGRSTPLLAFLIARHGTVLLLDEPDAHQHIVLQRDVYALLLKIARERTGLRRCRTTDLVLGHEAGAVLYVEARATSGFCGRGARVLMKPEEIHTEVVRKLDRMAEALTG